MRDYSGSSARVLRVGGISVISVCAASASGASFSIGLVGPKPYQCLFEPYQYSSEPYQCFVSTYL